MSSPLAFLSLQWNLVAKTYYTILTEIGPNLAECGVSRSLFACVSIFACRTSHQVAVVL
jgi:hypothetical protein